jgi:hypothetical protein
MLSSVETITPETAAQILANKNPSNRPLSRDRVRRYQQEMTEGRWMLSPQGLSFDGHGNLLDGQHRLSAVKASGAPQEFYVHRGVPTSAVRVLDQGLARTAAQIAAQELATDGPVSRLASASRAILELGLGAQKPSNSQIVDYAKLHLSVLQRYEPLGKHYTAGVHAAFAFAEISGLKNVAAAAKRLEDMLWDHEGDPMRALSKALLSMGGREGAKARATRFHTTLSALEYVDRNEDLLVARKYEAMPDRVSNSVTPGRE